MDARKSPPPPPTLPASPSDTPPRASRLPRAGTFRAQRPVSTNAAGLRRGTTFTSRPQSYAGDPSAALQDAAVAAPPRLRRGSSFVSLNTASPGEERPALRRGPSRAPDSDATTRLPRAGTFAFGSSGAKAASSALGAPSSISRQTSVSAEDAAEGGRRMSSAEKTTRQSRTCGMCSSCGVGLKGMPPWAPERLRTMTPAERALVMQELHQKEEKGRLEAELRKKRLTDLQAVSARLHARRMDSGRTEELEPLRSSRSQRETPVLGSRSERGASDDFDELESVDLGTDGTDKELSRKGSSKRRSRSRSGSALDEEAFGDDIGGTVRAERGRVRGGAERLDEDCGQCDGLEVQVSDLEEQLSVLREVVKVCSQSEAEREIGDGEGEFDAEGGKKPKTWKDKVLGAYYGHTASANERARLKEEVEALRKATDFLFSKMQEEAK